ncbi:MAG: hypothetical protein AAGJ31_16075, partial [Verrucomicrobiota bacterium]
EFALPHLIIQGALTELTLVGQPDAISGVAVENLSPVIVFADTTDLAFTTINYPAYNRRPLLLALSHHGENTTAVINHNIPSNADIRVFYFQQNSNAQFNIGAPSARIRGALMLEKNTSVVGGTLYVSEEADRSAFQSILPRTPWIESYRKL